MRYPEDKPMGSDYQEGMDYSVSDEYSALIEGMGLVNNDGKQVVYDGKQVKCYNINR